LDAQEATMKTKTFLALILGFTAAAAFAQADLRTGAQRTQASVRITVTIPGVVALEVPDEVVFDLSDYLKAGATVRPGEPCPDNVFPPPPGCSGPVRFTPTAVKTSSLEAKGLAAEPGESPLYLFSNAAGGTLDVKASVEPAWSGAGPGPGFPTSALRVQAGTGEAKARPSAPPRPLASAPETLLSLPARGEGWKRVALAFDLLIPDGASARFQEGTYTTVVTFTAVKA
jgi:hypothetical protein